MSPDYTWIAPTLLALGSLIGSLVTAWVAVKTSTRVGKIDVKVDAVQKATDGLMHTAVAKAAEEGRQEGAALATAGVAAAVPAIPSRGEK